MGPHAGLWLPERVAQQDFDGHDFAIVMAPARNRFASGYCGRRRESQGWSGRAVPSGGAVPEILPAVAGPRAASSIRPSHQQNRVAVPRQHRVVRQQTQRF